MKPCAAPAPDTTRPEPEPLGRPRGRTGAAWRDARRLEGGDTVNATDPWLASRVPHPAGDSPVRHRQARPALGSAQRSSSLMKIGAALAADLGILTAALDEPGADVLHSLHQLGVDAQAAVPTYLGLSVTVDGSDPPFTFTTLEGGAARDVRTSLRLRLPG